jgi:drug/metabolite transporter (DMT)-like permease
LRIKTWICAVVVVLSNVFGNFFMKLGMPASLEMLPVTAIGYVLVALVGKLLLHEAITGRRWAGILMIVAGVALVSGATAPQTVPRNAGAVAGE